MPSAHGVKIRRTRDRSRKKYPPPAKKVLPELVGARGVSQLGVPQQALAQIRESIVITDTEMKEPGPRIVYVNKAFTKLTGYLPKEVIGKIWGFCRDRKQLFAQWNVCARILKKVRSLKAKTSITAKMARSFRLIGTLNRCVMRKAGLHISSLSNAM